MKKQRNLTRFEHWEENDVNRRLNVWDEEQGIAFEELQRWISFRTEITPRTIENLEELRHHLEDFYTIWNEIELISHFIIPTINTVRYDSKYYRLFQEKVLKAEVQGFPVQGKVDAMVASGRGEFPLEPYFFLHEYKRSKGTDADPLGQLLITMLAAQAENEIQRPIYGCYVLGMIWQFVVLIGDRYAKSDPYLAIQADDLQRIHHMLHYVKQKVVEDIRKTYPDAE
jgi:hypothetical protein